MVCKTISSLDSIIKEPLEQFKLMEEALKRQALSKNRLLDMLLHLHKFSRKEKKRKEKKKTLTHNASEEEFCSTLSHGKRDKNHFQIISM